MKDLILAARALSDPTRVRVLLALREEELCVCELCDALDLTQSTLSTHLQVVRKANLVTTRKEGKWSYYAITPAAKRLLASLSSHFARSLAADRLLRHDAQNLKRRLALRDNGACCVGFGTSSPCCGTK